jgi:hypothetical protein
LRPSAGQCLGDHSRTRRGADAIAGSSLLSHAAVACYKIMTASNPALLRHWEYTGYVTVSRELRPVPPAPNLTGLSPALRPLVDAAKPRSRSRSRPRKTSSCSRRRLRASTSAQRASATPAGRRSPPAAGQCSPSDLVRPCWPPLDYLSPPPDSIGDACRSSRPTHQRGQHAAF